MTAVEVDLQGEQLAVTAHRLLGTLAQIVGKAELLRRHREDLDRELSDRWLIDIEAHAREVSRQLQLVARGLPADLGVL